MITAVFRDKFYRDVLKNIILVGVALLLCRVTYGILGWGLLLLGCKAALRGDYKTTLFCYLFFPLTAVFNPIVCGVTFHLALAAKVGNIVLALFLLSTLTSNDKRLESLPIHWIFVYMFVAAVSSADGWFPMISYLKLLQFFGFISSIMIIAKIIQKSDYGVHELRAVMMALAVIMTVGSWIVSFVPTIGYSMTIGRMEMYGMNYTLQEFYARNGIRQLNGMTRHSQMLAPTVSILATWVLCDVIFVERRFRLLHSLVLVITPVLLYMSRSRGGLLTLVVVMCVTMFVCIPNSRLPSDVRTQFTHIIVALEILMVLGGGYLEVRDGVFSKWLRKTDDIGGDNRSLMEAVTSTRMLLIKNNLDDFRQNPLLGKGFQVTPSLKDAYRYKMITWFSAPVEKGVTPVVILGETGLLGAGVFLVFLVVFYATCMKRKYYALMNLFTCNLVSNLADSTLFSPAGLGGFLWVVSCIGGFGIDIITLRVNMQERALEYQLGK